MSETHRSPPVGSGPGKPANRLSGEKSPYLLQHASNPVDWFPWGEAALEKARREKKTIFLSVGYSTCHWCHVMARESFENDDIAAVLNRHFVSVKVDREERPDVDRVYMTYVQAATGGGGWPMSVWLTPDLKPFFGGTYFPPDDRWGRTGFRTVLTRIAAAWAEDPGRLVAAAADTMDRLRAATAAAPGDAAGLDRRILDRAFARIRETYDPRHGGFGGAPKFPRPSEPDFLLRYHARSGNRAALDMTMHTLRAMAGGGMYDQLGGGFHRYSVDERWHVPHFEKMLYDQAQLACTYLDAFRITKDPRFARIARETLEYVRRDLCGPDGRFYSAEDADSDVPGRPGEHGEGAFYVWEHDEVVERLGAGAAALFNFRYGVEPDGNVRDDPHGEFPRKNVLYVAHTIEETAARFDRPPDEVRRALTAAAATLCAARALRPRPLRDDKTLTAWNGLMISAFARGSAVLDEPAWRTAARAAAAFLREKLYDPRAGTLLRRYCDGDAAIDGQLDDYAFLIRGLLDLYEAGFDVGHLAWAVALQEKQDALFTDEANGGYFATTGADASVLLRIKDGYDGAEPSANSVSAQNLLRLARMTDRPDYARRAERTLAAFSQTLTRAPNALPAMLSALDAHLRPPRQIIIAGAPDAADTRALLRAVRERFLPDTALLLADGGAGQAALARHIEFIATLAPIQGRATAYVCAHGACQLPTDDPAALAAALDRIALAPESTA